MPDFQWTQVVLLCGLSLVIGYILATNRWHNRKPKDPPAHQEPGKTFPRSHDTPATRVLEEQFQSGRLGFDESLELAATYRRQGDIQSAIDIHQSLYGRPGLSWKSQQRAQFELALDFFHAGILGRAEDLLKSLIPQNGPHTAEAVRLLLVIYQQEQDWEEALTLFERHPSLSDSGLHWEHVHMLCEQAEALMGRDPSRVKQLTRKAIQLTSSSLRPELIQMRMAMEERRWRELSRLVTDFLSRPDPRTDLLRPVIKHLRDSQPRELPRLVSVLSRKNDDANVRLLHGELLFDMGREEEGIQLIRSVPLNMDTLKWRLQHQAQALNSIELQHMVDELTRQQSQQPYYQCSHCGYESHSHHWHCPQCNRWESLLPSDKKNGKLLI